MDPSDHDQYGLGSGAADGIDRPRHASGTPDEAGRWLRSVVENSSEMITIVDPDGTLRYANPAWERVLGYDSDEAIGTMNVFDHVHPDDLSHVLEETEKVPPEGGIFTNEAEYRFRRKDGSWRWMESMGTYLLDDPAVGGLVVTSRDVTERKEAEERLRFQAQLLGAVGESVIALDLDGRILYWNRAAEGMYGWSAEEAMGRRLREMVVPENLRGRAEDIAAQLRKGRSWEGQFEVRRRDGTTFTVEGTDTPVFGQDGGLVGVIGVLRDITERKEIEEALRRNEKYFRSLVQNASDVITVLEADGTIRYVSHVVEQVTGHRPEEQIGANAFDSVHPDDKQRALGVFAEVLKMPGVHSPIEFRVPHMDGSWRHLEHVVNNLLDDASVNGIVVTSRDVTERKRAEEAIRKSERRLRRAEERYRRLVEQVPAVVYVQEIGSPDSAMYMSPRIEALTGYSPEECRDPELRWRMVHPEDRERMRSEDKRAGEPGEVFASEYRVVHRDGRTVWVRNESVLVEGAEGGPRYWQGFMTDITERVRAEEALRGSERRFRSSFEDAAIGMALLGTDGRWLRVNRSLCEIVGYTEEELLSKTFQDITHPHDLGSDLDHVRRMLSGEIRTYQMEKRYLHKEGHVLWILLSVSLVHDEEGEPLYFISQIQDITDRKRMEVQLQRQALHDSLTGLPNRKLFVDRLGQALERTRRRENRRAAVLFMDLDGFKLINDSLGHEVGDLLLTVVAQRLRRCLRPEDTLSRFGGDEFVVLLPDVGDPEEAIRVAVRISEELRRPFLLEGREIFASASVGIALGDARRKSPEELLRDADAAMYVAKDEGSGYRMFDPAMYEQAVRRLDLENDLKRAAEADEFVVHYQPIVDLETGGVWGVEALVRWRHPRRGLLEPSQFMPVVEESGLVVPVGRRVLEAACRQARLWQGDSRLPSLVLCVNLSAVQLRRADLARTVEETLRDTGLEASHLSLDLTETSYIKVLEARTATLDRIKALGVRLSIDDFGVGYSSLSYLKRLPADVLKIDKSFVRGLGENNEDTAIVRMVVDLAHTLGMEVVAEGVETEEQETLLKEMGCDMAQGFFFSKPLPPEAASEFLNSNHERSA